MHQEGKLEENRHDDEPQLCLALCTLNETPPCDKCGGCWSIFGEQTLASICFSSGKTNLKYPVNLSLSQFKNFSEFWDEEKLANGPD